MSAIAVNYIFQFTDLIHLPQSQCLQTKHQLVEEHVPCFYQFVQLQTSLHNTHSCPDCTRGGYVPICCPATLGGLSLHLRIQTC